MSVGSTVVGEVDYHKRALKLAIPSDAFIDGAPARAASGARFDCVSPRDGRVLAHVAECDAIDIDQAVRAARTAFADGRWAAQAPRARRDVLLRLAELIEDHAEELALLDVLDMGKPISDALAVDVRVAATSVRYFAEAIDKVYGEVAPTARDAVATITREPVGVVGAVLPWNAPLIMVAWKAGPALAMGNSIVVKPAEQSPLSALRFAELAAEAGLPDGVLNVVPGYGTTAGAALGLHPDVDAIAFTGSGAVGRHFLRYSADSNLKRVALELGGKSPQIVFADAPDDAEVAASVAASIFYNQGEICSAGSRLLVHRSRKDEIVAAVAAEARRRAPADPLDVATQTGAVVESRHLDRILGHLDSGRAQGARIVVGGHRVLESTGGFYVEPTVLDDVTPNMRVAQEEIFGPVLSVMAFDDTDEAISMANGTRYGLAASVWTRSLSTAHTVARAIHAGIVWVNNVEGSDVTVPFGGTGESGFGHDQSLHALDNYTNLKSTWIRI